MAKGGAPTKLTPELQTKIVAFIRAGGYVETAAAAAGINKSTFYDWLKRGAAQKAGPYREFSDAVEKAAAESEMADVARINKAAQDGVWQAAAWRLERKFPERWGRKERTDPAAGGGDTPIVLQYVPKSKRAS